MPNLLVLQNANADKVTAVAYLDQSLQEGGISDEMKARVNKMIRKQMKEMDASKDYLGDRLPVPKLPTLESTWLKAEIERAVQS